MTPFTILGLDPSLSSTGACWVKVGQHGDIKAVWHTTLPTEKGQPEERRAAQLRQDMASMLVFNPADVVFYESGSFGSVGRQQTLGGVSLMLRALLYDNGCELQAPVAPSKLKVYVTDHGKAPKSEMVRTVKAEGYPVKNDDEADAVSLAAFGCDLLLGESLFTSPFRRALSGVDRPTIPALDSSPAP